MTADARGKIHRQFLTPRLAAREIINRLSSCYSYLATIWS
jgi:hypothetical protein